MGVVIVLLLAVIVAVALAVLFFIGLMVSLAIVIVRAITRRRPRNWSVPPPRWGRWPTTAGEGASLREPSPLPPRELPPDVQAQADRIRLKAEGLLRQGDRFAAGSRQHFVVQRTVTDYLPRTLSTYLDLPAGQDDLAVSPDGRSALQVLRGQLELLEGRLDEIARDLYRRNLDRLFANGRFLEEGVRQPASELDLPVP